MVVNKFSKGSCINSGKYTLTSNTTKKLSLNSIN
jgi:hypothetical protein